MNAFSIFIVIFLFATTLADYKEWLKIKNNEDLAEYLMFGNCKVMSGHCDFKLIKPCKNVFKHCMFISPKSCEERREIYYSCANELSVKNSVQLKYDPCEYETGTEGTDKHGKNGGLGGSGGGAERSKGYQPFYVYRSGVADEIGEETTNQFTNCMMKKYNMINNDEKALELDNINFQCKKKASLAKSEVYNCASSTDGNVFSLKKFFECTKKFCMKER